MSPPAYPPIADYAFLSDCHSGALVSRDGSVDWCAFHRADARPVFCRLLDWEQGGFFRVAPAGPYSSTRHYLPGTNVLETRFEGDGWALLLTDLIPIEAEGVHPGHRLLRIARCLEGEVGVQVAFEPRFDYGLTAPRVQSVDSGLAVVYGGADALVLQTELPIGEVGASSCEAARTLREGEEAFICLTYVEPHQLADVSREVYDAREALARTVRFWREWSARCTYRGPYREAVERSALVLKGLTNAPTGAIVAASTTSLPEQVGGIRNWDYRYSWLRDSSLTLDALYAIGYTDEADEYLEWLRLTTAGRVDDLQILYGVGGERLLPEFQLDHLEGYRGSRPVRIGNAASSQFQLDVYGELVDTAWLSREWGRALDPIYWELLVDVAEAVCERWRHPDAGIWEIRGEPQHFVYSKVMCWVALDRAVRLAERDGLEAPLARWRAARDEIRETVEREGVDASGAFVQAFGSDSIDASNLRIPLMGFVAPDDPRAIATVERVQAELCVDGFVQRYVPDGVDGLPGGEGAFVVCSFWLVEYLARSGRSEEAREIFERLVSCSSDLGLLAEEIDPGTRELLGNFPQAFSHLGLILAAIALDPP